MEEFENISETKTLKLPRLERLQRIIVLPANEFHNITGLPRNVMAMTELDDRSSEIILSDALLKNRYELQLVLFHELLHAAGYDHPVRDCHWLQQGCGIMGRSTYPNRPLSPQELRIIIRKSLRPEYLANLPQLPIANMGQLAP